MSQAWTFAIDRGGTFTDIVAARADGAHRGPRNCCPTIPAQYADAAVEGIRRVLAAEGGDARRGPDGHHGRDQRLARAQGRAASRWRSPPASATRCGSATRRGPTSSRATSCCPSMLYEHGGRDRRAGRRRGRGAARRSTKPRRAPALQARSRRRASRARDRADARLALDRARGARWPTIAREIGFTQVSVSHEVAPLIKLIGRGDTTVVDAYLSPVLRRYVDQVAAGLAGGAELPFHAVERRADRRRARSAARTRSCPARPAASSAWRGQRAARRASRLIGFDMGGTSTDVSHYAGGYERTNESDVAGVRVRAPMLEIHTVAAGGGSICRFDGMRFRVGPDSAGAVPGPGLLPARRAADRHRLQRVPRQDRPEHFPAVFGPDGDQPIDRRGVAGAAARRSPARSAARRARGRSPRASSRIAVDNMANAIKQDLDRARPRRHPLHACNVSAAPAASMPASSPTRSAWSGC